MSPSSVREPTWSTTLRPALPGCCGSACARHWHETDRGAAAAGAIQPALLPRLCPVRQRAFLLAADPTRAADPRLLRRPVGPDVRWPERLECDRRAGRIAAGRGVYRPRAGQSVELAAAKESRAAAAEPLRRTAARLRSTRPLRVGWRDHQPLSRRSAHHGRWPRRAV